MCCKDVCLHAVFMYQRTLHGGDATCNLSGLQGCAAWCLWLQGTCKEEVVTSLLQALMTRSDAELTTPYAR